MDEWQFARRGNGGLQNVLSHVAQDPCTFAEWLQLTIDDLPLSKGEVIRRSELNPTYGYQIISGQKHAKRDKLLQLALGMGLGIDKTSELLERGGVNRLNVHDRRDVVIAFCCERNTTVLECDKALAHVGLLPLREEYPNVRSWYV